MYNTINTRYTIQDVELSHPETRTCLNRLLSPSVLDTRRLSLQTSLSGHPLETQSAYFIDTFGAVRGDKNRQESLLN